MRDAAALQRWWAVFRGGDAAEELPVTPRLGACEDPGWEQRCCGSCEGEGEGGLLRCSYMVSSPPSATTTCMSAARHGLPGHRAAAGSGRLSCLCVTGRSGRRS